MKSWKNYNLIEFTAAKECDNFFVLEPKWISWAENCFSSLTNKDYIKEHKGDCTNDACSCYLCNIESMLADFREFNLDPEEWRRNNLSM